MRLVYQLQQLLLLLLLLPPSEFGVGGKPVLNDADATRVAGDVLSRKLTSCLEEKQKKLSYLYKIKNKP
jgi:hypothetical protein